MKSIEHCWLWMAVARGELCWLGSREGIRFRMMTPPNITPRAPPERWQGQLCRAAQLQAPQAAVHCAPGHCVTHCDRPLPNTQAQQAQPAGPSSQPTPEPAALHMQHYGCAWTGAALPCTVAWSFSTVASKPRLLWGHTVRGRQWLCLHRCASHMPGTHTLGPTQLAALGEVGMPGTGGLGRGVAGLGLLRQGGQPFWPARACSAAGAGPPEAACPAAPPAQLLCLRRAGLAALAPTWCLGGVT